MPRVYIADNPQPNAFATGRNPEHAAVCATTGLLRMLSRDEIAGVMAHELGHVRNRDTLTMTITATIAGADLDARQFRLLLRRLGGNRNNPLGIVGVLVAAIVAPIAAMLVQMAISRTREYSADRAGAEISGRPDALASALAKIASAAAAHPQRGRRAQPGDGASVHRQSAVRRRMDNLFSTHPATENRIAALMADGRATLRPAPAAPAGRRGAPRRTTGRPARSLGIGLAGRAGGLTRWADADNHRTSDPGFAARAAATGLLAGVLDRRTAARRAARRRDRAYAAPARPRPRARPRHRRRPRSAATARSTRCSTA